MYDKIKRFARRAAGSLERSSYVRGAVVGAQFRNGTGSIKFQLATIRTEKTMQVVLSDLHGKQDF